MEPSRGDAVLTVHLNLPLATPTVLLPRTTVSPSNRKQRLTRDLVILGPHLLIGSVMSVDTAIPQEDTLYVNRYSFHPFLLAFANCLFYPFQCDSESEELEKANNHQELRGLSPNGGNNRPTEFVAPIKRSFSPGHASMATNSHSIIANASSSSSNSNASTIENCNNLRWVGLSGSPRPATAVAPLGHLQVCTTYIDVVLEIFVSSTFISVFRNKEWTATVGLSANRRRCWSESGWTSGNSFTSITTTSSGCWISTQHISTHLQPID